MTASASSVKMRIEYAFADAKYPGDQRLVDSDEGSEPELVARDFKGKSDWHALKADFIDRSPDELATALAFFSDEAFRFYLPAYLIADLDGLLKLADPAYHLTHGFDDGSRVGRVNSLRFGEMTWSDYAVRRCSGLSAEQVDAVAAYLELKAEKASAHDKNIINQALANYWRKRDNTGMPSL